LTSTTEELLQTLKIYHLSQEEYDQKVADGTIEDDAIYMTPDAESYTKDDIDLLLTEINNALFQKSSVEICRWGADD
jgi:hypothetical protein